jgi:murein DD-endopeptidase MepM/ murein hydrolase activator NlpD
MTGTLFWRVLTAALIFPVLALAQPQRAAPPAVTLTPAAVFAGSPELVRVVAPKADSVDGEWLRRKIVFFRGRDGWFALAGADVEAHAGPSTLHITAHAPGKALDLSRPVTIHAARYRTEKLSVAPKFVAPGPEELKQIDADRETKKKVFASSAPEPLWRGSFRAPVDAEPTDSFGVRRTFNGKLASVHMGADFRARMGTPVRAANSGVVVLARTLYFEGNCVVIDHGMGLFTLSMHFSRIDVKEGQRVNAGDQLGLSGDTGRVTGPHLHFAVRWQGANLDPLKLIRLDLNGLR